MRRVLASLSSAVIALGLLIGVAPGAQAADLGTVTVSYDASAAPTFVSFAPTALTGGAGDTFTFVNNRYNSVSSYISIENGTGSATMGGTPCTSSTACQVLDKNPPPRTAVVTVVNPGTFTVYRFTSGAPTSIGTLTITGGSGTAVTDPALVYPTLYLNANGGTCTGAMQFTKYNGQNGQITVPTSETCTRSGYSLLGWSSSGDANSGVWLPGSMVPIGDESFTLYAAWFADGLEVTYDANVGMSTECVKDGANLSNVADRSVTRVITPRSEGEALRYDGAYFTTWTATSPAPVCSPPGYEFLGWSEFASGPAFKPSELMLADPSRPDVLGLFLPGTEITLYAQWGVTWGVQMTATSQQLTPGGTATLTVTALRDGSADAGAPRQLRIVDSAGAVSLFSPFTSPSARTSQFQTNSDGTLSIPIYASQTPGAGSITAAYGDASQTLEFTVASPQPPSIVITGERRTVNGRPGIQVDGTATGLPEGTKLIPWFRFPGQTDYSQSSARPTTNAEGEFSWQRKTGKKVDAIFTDEDGLVQSNRVIIPAK